MITALKSVHWPIFQNVVLHAGGSQLTDMEQTLQEAQVNNAVLVMRWLAAQ